MNIKFDMGNAVRNFASGIDLMSKLTGIDAKVIVTAEAGSVLKRAISKTRRAPSQAILTTAGRLAALKALGLTGGGRAGNRVTITAGLKGTQYGKVWYRKEGGGLRTNVRQSHAANYAPLDRHFTDAQWSEISAAINDAEITIDKVVPEKKASAGLARQSWILIGDALGIRLEAVPGGSLSSGAITSARAARARGNKNQRNGTAYVDAEAGKFAVTLINRLPYGNRLGFQGILTAAVAGRVKFMQTALAKGFVGSVQDTARLFPGWTVNAANN